ncbi:MULTISPECIES: glycosyltransferase family 4 protein [unclassified Actinomyces]|uniref:glycosyltransferase family 4 protein n=1 Tax=unclassified Actinomyces TaxID=2609248 RepID=UPI000D5A1383|nr:MULTISPECIES: glycosyltransferase family 4 protein [unclassified Actinomyces]RAX21256.1 glycosyltransferase family 1 protein [Actinomyces sp. Z3]
MHLAIVTNSYPPRLGGLESHVSNLAQGLDDLGHRVHVLTISSERSRRNDGGVKVLTGRAHLPIAEVISFPGPGTARAIAQYLRREHVDVVSTHTRFFPMSLVGMRAAQAAGLPVIHTEHGSGFVASPSPIITVGSRAVDLTAGRYVLRHADRVLGVSPEAAAFARRLGAPHADVFYNAITPSVFTDAVPDRPDHLVFVGRVVAGKGWDTFLRAVSALRAAGQDVTGELLGDGAQLAQARRECRTLGLNGVVAIRGRVPQEQARAALRGATLVNPTVLSEGFQTTLLETIAERGRVVTFEVPGAQLLRESGAPVKICRERSLDCLVTALQELLDNPPVPASRELIDPWTWPVRAREYSEVVGEVLAGR